MPARLLPGANEVAPQKWAIPLPVEMTRAPVGGSTRDICGEPSFVDLNDLEAAKIVVHVLYDRATFHSKPTPIFCDIQPPSTCTWPCPPPPHNALPLATQRCPSSRPDSFYCSSSRSHLPRLGHNAGSHSVQVSSWPLATVPRGYQSYSPSSWGYFTHPSRLDALCPRKHVLS